MRIIVEGIKGVGKTTFINRLAKVFGLQVFHPTNKSNNNMEMFEAMLQQDNWISDRGPYGQFVYGAEHLQIGSLSELRKLENKFIAAGVVVIYMRPIKSEDENVYQKIVERYRPTCTANELEKNDKQYTIIFESESLIVPKVIDVDILNTRSKEGI